MPVLPRTSRLLHFGVLPALLWTAPGLSAARLFNTPAVPSSSRRDPVWNPYP